MSSIIIIYYIYKVWPFTVSYLNYLEIYNEVTLILCALLTYGFSDYEAVETIEKERTQMKDMIGWVFIGIVGVYIAVNLISIANDIYKGLLGKVRNFIEKR